MDIVAASDAFLTKMTIRAWIVRTAEEKKDLRMVRSTGIIDVWERR